MYHHSANSIEQKPYFTHTDKHHQLSGHILHKCDGALMTSDIFIIMHIHIISCICGYKAYVHSYKNVMLCNMEIKIYQHCRK